MYKLSQIFADVMTSADRSTWPESMKEVHLANIAVAITVAYQMSLPTSPVEREMDYYLAHVLPAAEEMIGRINEQAMPVSVFDTLELTKRIWLTRYSLLHNPMGAQSLEVLVSAIHSAGEEFADVYRTAAALVDVATYNSLIGAVRDAIST